MDSNDEQITTIANGSAIKGSIKSQCNVVIDGHMEGDVEAPLVRISASGTLIGNVSANSIESFGSISGEMHASKFVLNGRIEKDSKIIADSIEFSDAEADQSVGITLGECEIYVGEIPSIEEMVRVWSNNLTGQADVNHQSQSNESQGHKNISKPQPSEPQMDLEDSSVKQTG